MEYDILIKATDEDLDLYVREICCEDLEDIYIINDDNGYRETDREGYIKYQVDNYKQMRQALINSN